MHPFSSHTYQLRLFAARGGLDLDAATRMVVIPPPWIAEALRSGQIDGFCAGSPWNSVAVAQGYGRIAAFGCDLAPDCPEKVLALPGYAAAGSAPLVRAVRRAGRWCADPGNHDELAGLLAQPRHLGIDPALIRRALAGTVTVDPDGTTRRAPRFVMFGEAAECPRRAQADWLLDRMAEADQIELTPAVTARAGAVYRPDLCEAAGTEGPLPPAPATCTRIVQCGSVPPGQPAPCTGRTPACTPSPRPGRYPVRHSRQTPLLVKAWNGSDLARRRTRTRLARPMLAFSCSPTMTSPIRRQSR